MNLQALAAMDECEHATGMTLAEHIRQTPREIVADWLMTRLDVCHHADAMIEARHLVESVRAAGYQVVQVVQTGNKPFP